MIEKDTVVIGLEEYNSLRDFREAEQRGLIPVGYMEYGHYEYITKDEVIGELMAIKKRQETEIWELKTVLKESGIKQNKNPKEKIPLFDRILNYFFS